MKHYSPSPWIETEDEDGNVIVKMDDAHSVIVANLEGSCITCRANARLIKAAPEILEALIELYESEWMVSHDWGGDRNSVLEKVDSVIKKATLPQ